MSISVSIRSCLWALTLGLLTLSGAPAHAKPADCLFEIDGKTLIDGACQFVAGRGGDFRIFTLKGAGIEYAVEIERGPSGEALGVWNGDAGYPRTQSQIGLLRPAGACWSNARARVCAWRLGEARYFVEAPASGASGGVPTQVGACVQTQIAMLGSRLEGAPDSGSAITYANGINGVSYDVIAALRNSRVGDPVTLCLVSLPQDCPKGDDRGKVYSATNLRTQQGWSLPDSQHMCGGA